MSTHKSPDGEAVTLREHLDALRAGDALFHEERDRRYAEVAQEREKALKIKETADLAALELAREIQTYKDEKAGGLGDQFNRERGLYATKGDLAASMERIELAIKPLTEFVSSQQGASLATQRAQNTLQPWAIWLAGAVVAVAALVSNNL